MQARVQRSHDTSLLRRTFAALAAAFRQRQTLRARVQRHLTARLTKTAAIVFRAWKHLVFLRRHHSDTMGHLRATVQRRTGATYFRRWRTAYAQHHGALDCMRRVVLRLGRQRLWHAWARWRHEVARQARLDARAQGYFTHRVVLQRLRRAFVWWRHAWQRKREQGHRMDRVLRRLMSRSVGGAFAIWRTAASRARDVERELAAAGVLADTDMVCTPFSRFFRNINMLCFVFMTQSCSLGRGVLTHVFLIGCRFSSC